MALMDEVLRCRSCGFEFGEDEAKRCETCRSHICPKCKECLCDKVKGAFLNGVLSLSFPVNQRSSKWTDTVNQLTWQML